MATPDVYTLNGSKFRQLSSCAGGPPLERNAGGDRPRFRHRDNFMSLAPAERSYDVVINRRLIASEEMLNIVVFAFVRRSK